MLSFCLTCKFPAPVGSKFAQSSGLAAPVVAATPLVPALPSIPLLPKISQKTTILLMGVDSNGLKADPFLGTRSDTMMLVSIDPVSNKVGVVSIPRDSRVRVPSHGVDKINSAHAFGGPELAMQTVREAFGVPVDHYIAVDTGGLKKLFEILGPVEILVEKEMHYVDHTAKLNVDLQPGLQQLSPAQAEEYVRFRHDARGDIGRIERQQWFVRQAAKKFKDPQIVLKLPELVCLGYQCIRTDLPMQDVLGIAAYAKDFPHEKVVTAMLPGDARYIGGGSYWIPDPLAGQVMFARILGCSVSEIQPTEVAKSSGASSVAVGVSAATASGAANALALNVGVTPLASTTGSIGSSAGVPSGDPAQAASLNQDGRSSKRSVGLECDMTKPPSVTIKYPHGAEALSQAIADQLTQAGFRVKYRFQIADVDCQHELLIEQSPRANDESSGKMCQSIPELQNFPRSLAIEAHPSSDFTIIISADSQMPSICHGNVALPTVLLKAPPLNMSATAIPILPQE